MKYFRFKTVAKDFTTLEPVIPPDIVSYRYNDTLIGVNISDSQEFLAQQHAECEVSEVTFAEIESELKSCRLYHDIDDIVKTMIHNKYTLDDEIKLLKLEKTDPVYVEYQSYVDSCRAIGSGLKVERGLKQPIESPQVPQEP